MKKVNLSIEKKSYATREAVRTLRTNLQFCGDDKRVILVTSCVPGEGKTSVSVSLAESIADMGKSVILVDADIRKSVMASRLGITGVEKGLSHFLSGQRFSGMLESMKNVYDYIIIDCPPLGVVIDAAIIGRLSDGAIMVVEAGKTKYRLAQNVKDQLENSGASVLGVVLNKVEQKNQKRYYNKYYGSYKYEGYYRTDDDEKNA